MCGYGRLPLAVFLGDLNFNFDNEKSKQSFLQNMSASGVKSSMEMISRRSTEKHLQFWLKQKLQWPDHALDAHLVFDSRRSKFENWNQPCETGNSCSIALPGWGTADILLWKKYDKIGSGSRAW